MDQSPVASEINPKINLSLGVEIYTALKFHRVDYHLVFQLTSRFYEPADGFSGICALFTCKVCFPRDEVLVDSSANLTRLK